MLVEEKQLIPDTGGEGTHRGGCGQRCTLTSYSEAPITFAMRGDRVQHPALGLFGGGSGAAGSVTLNGKPIHSKRTLMLQNGDRLVLETPGGGGYGPAAERAEAAREDDLKNG